MKRYGGDRVVLLTNAAVGCICTELGRERLLSGDGVGEVVCAWDYVHGFEIG